MLGLSPPTRGSREVRRLHAVGRRSIPAHTGKPRGTPSARCRPPVYPRPHGEARDVGGREDHSEGLSPPTRGSLHCPGASRTRARSIPAHTGKPPTPCAPSRPPRVYPRPHGEAGVVGPGIDSGKGLSPPTRGSRSANMSAASIARSIPAHTGKPRRPTARRRPPRVYPRPHGEARSGDDSPGQADGLSPPTRGSHG